MTTKEKFIEMAKNKAIPESLGMALILRSECYESSCLF